jgi:hypothetical protein
MKPIPKRTPRFFNCSWMGDESWEVTRYGIKLFPTAKIQTMIGTCFKSLLILWCIVYSFIDLGTIIPFDCRSSHSEIPTSFSLTTSLLGWSWTNSVIYYIVSSRKQRGTSKCCASYWHFSLHIIRFCADEWINSPKSTLQVACSESQDVRGDLCVSRGYFSWCCLESKTIFLTRHLRQVSDDARMSRKVLIRGWTPL